MICSAAWQNSLFVHFRELLANFEPKLVIVLEFDDRSSNSKCLEEAKKTMSDMVDCLRDDHTLLSRCWVLYRRIGQSLEVARASREHEEVRTDDLKATEVLVRHTKNLVGLVGPHKLLSELIHLGRRDRS